MMGAGFDVIMVTADLVPTGEFKLCEGLLCADSRLSHYSFQRLF
jgi:hypothetical protein